MAKGRRASERAEPAEAKAPAKPRKGFWREVREIWDTIVLAFVLVTLMKTFVVDLYKIPSGSMTPTLIGDWITWDDYDGDGDDDLLVLDVDASGGDTLGRHWVARQVFIRQPNGDLICGTDEHRGLQGQRPLRRYARSQVQLREDRILVNKMWYWFTPLTRGDILVFKLPEDIFNLRTPFYIKRVVGFEGEVPSIDDQGSLLIDGEIVSEPRAFERNHYFNDQLNPHTGARFALPWLGEQVPEDSFVVFGDNSGNSQDSRYWGAVEAGRVRGRAFFRYWPLTQIGFLR